MVTSQPKPSNDNVKSNTQLDLRVFVSYRVIKALKTQGCLVVVHRPFREPHLYLDPLV